MPTCVDHKSCVKNALQKADSICRDRGLRFTELRRNVLEIIWEDHCPAKAYDILDKLNQHKASYKAPTVYRALDFLLENGLIHKIKSLNAYVGCSHPLKHNECYFLICGACGEVKECYNDKLARAISKTADKNKFNLGDITVEVAGKCRECSRKQ